MRWPRKILMLVRSLFHRGAVDRELEDEMRFHLERQIATNMEAGMTRKEARNAALREFGGVEQYKEECRDTRRANWLLDFLQDVRYGIRGLVKNKGFAAIAVLTLALGIGANTAIFSLIDAVMLRTLPIRDPQGLVILRWAALHDPKTGVSYSWGGCPGNSRETTNRPPGGCSFSYPLFEEIVARRGILTNAAAFIGSRQFHVTSGGQVSLGSGYLVSGDFFDTLGTRAAMGRTLDARDDKAGAPDVAFLSYGYWRSEFGGDPSVVGKTVLIENRPFTIVGVGSPGFAGIDPGVTTDLWVPLASRERVDPYLPKPTARNSIWLEILARLKPGVAKAEAQSALSVIYANETTIGPGAMFKQEDRPRIELEDASRGLVSLRQEYSQPLFVLMAAVGIILLIACANVGGLSLARATSRRAEIAVRLTLGASRGRIVRQLLTESLIISTAGAALGVLVAYWSAGALAGFLSANSYFPLDLNVAPNARILAFTVVVSIVTGILFGLAPALQGIHVEVAPGLKGASCVKKDFPGMKRLGAASLLVAGQVTLSVVVLAGAGLLVHTLVKLQRMDVGFQPNNVLICNVDMSMENYKGFSDPRVYPMDRELQTRLASLPGVRSVGYSALALLSGGSGTSTYPPNEPGGNPILADQLAIGPGFLETMKIPLRAGRDFTRADFETAAKPTPVMVNERFARKYFGEPNPLGKTFGEGQLQVIGVTADAKYDSLRNDVEPTIYTMEKSSGGTFELRTSGNPKALIPLVRDAVRKVSGNFLVSHIETQEEQIDQLLYQERLVASLSALFGALALLLACIGLYGLLSYEVERGTREIGIRMALGAPEGEVLRLVIRRGIGLVSAGASIGIVVAAELTRYLQTLLYGVRPTDPYSFAAAIILLGLVAALACYLPARRAMRVDPMVALRYE